MNPNPLSTRNVRIFPVTIPLQHGDVALTPGLPERLDGVPPHGQARRVRPWAAQSPDQVLIIAHPRLLSVTNRACSAGPGIGGNHRRRRGARFAHNSRMAPQRSLSPGTSGPRSSNPTAGFAALGLSDAVVAAVTALGYEEPTPVQRETIPLLLSGGDLLAEAA